MCFEWNAHRFSGGVLALDLANTVIFREDRERSLDRFADTAEVPRFAEAAATFRSGEWGRVRFHAPRSQDGIKALIDVREVVNRLFRDAAGHARIRADYFSEFLHMGANVIREEGAEENLELPSLSDSRRELSLGAAAFLSALRLLDPARLERIKICPNCHWLYFDESRNRSRRWCDMNVCGNRAKARRHYVRSLGHGGNDHA
jgi:predicted RNA-binding Zn ribbon-like protein